MKVQEDVFTFRIPWPRYDEKLSVHVVKKPGKTLLFGTGDESTAERVIEIARTYEVDVVIPEHGHHDHFGGAPYLRNSLPVETAIPAADAIALEERGLPVDYNLSPNEQYWGIQTIHVPGHTPGNTAYLYNDCLIAGDTFVGSDSIFAIDRSWSGRLAILRKQYSQNHEQFCKNIENLLQYNFEVVLVSHGSHVLQNGGKEVEDLVTMLSY